VTTIKHLELALPFLRSLKARYGERITFKVIGDGRFADEGLGIRGQPWRAAEEVSDLTSLDIGIMPLPDDEWARGKCGLKGLQYMALEIPTVMSPVGVNCEIVHDGQNGFLAAEAGEWTEKLSRLIESSELRERIGRAGRETVKERYSVKVQRGRYLEYFTRLCEERP
jgi:glycosyltransferase involved in cell wall biosynthesis